MPRPGGMLPVAAVLVLLLFSHGFCAEWENPLGGNPSKCSPGLITIRS